MPELARLIELESMARRLAKGTADDDARAKLQELADQLASQIQAMEAGDGEPKDEPPLPAPL